MSSKLVRRPFRSRSMRAEGPASRVEQLESRALLSTLPVIQPTYRLAPLVTYTTPPSGSFVPAQIQQAYQFNLVSGNGSGETIAIVDAYNDSSIQSDLNTFDTQFGLPSTTVSVVNQTGGSKLPSGDSTGGWEMEESLDVEWAHAMAPGAKILLVEANSPSNSDLLTAVGYASQHANVVSMSWGGGEFSGEASYDSSFSTPGVAYVVASGDSGAPAEWPAASPNVLSVGGTALALNSSGGWGSETGWSGSTGGPSAYETQPAYQANTATGTTMRATPDVAYDGASTGTYAVYDSYPYEVSYRRTQSLGWVAVYGTSAGAPQWASILAIADQARASAGLPALNASSPQQVMSLLYQNPGDFHDITSGTSTGNPQYTAGPGYDYVTGLGTPMVNMVVGSLAGGGGGTTSDTIAVSTSSNTTTAGTSISYTVTADGANGSVDTGFTGTISLSSSDSKIQGLPSSYTFTTTDAGTHTFTVTLETAGSQTITETSASGSVVSTIQVSPAAASKLVISGLSTAVVGTPQSFTVTAEDPYGNVATSYTGTVSFASSDSKATLPGTYTFTTTDAGQKAFSVTFGTSGSQNLTVTDTTSSLSTTQSVTVSSPPPPGPQSIWGTSYPATVNTKYQGQRGQTFELGVQFEASVAGNVTSVLFYKQPKTKGTNVGHLWSSSGTLLASVTFSNETGSGWQQANFASAVPISANTFYTISYDTGSPVFSYDLGYFASNGVTNGNLTAPQSTTINGVTLDNGVYNYGGLFPNASKNSANFWVDLVFTPTTGAAVGVKTSSPTAPRNGRNGSVRVTSGDIGTSTGSPTPAGPMGVLPGSQESPSTTAKRPSFSFAVVSYRPVVRQARMPVLWGHRPTSLSS